MLYESLVLLLIDQRVIGKAEALESINDVVELKRDIAGVSESVVVGMTSIALMRQVAHSVAAASKPHERVN